MTRKCDTIFTEYAISSYSTICTYHFMYRAIGPTNSDKNRKIAPSCDSYLDTICVVYSMHYIVSSVLCYMHCTLSIVFYALYSMPGIYKHCILYISFCAMSSMHHIVCIVLYAVCSMHCFVLILFYAFYSIPWIL